MDRIKRKRGKGEREREKRVRGRREIYVIKKNHATSGCLAELGSTGKWHV